METHNIEEEIIMDMFIMLPVKSLIRFKCVSKFWNTLILQPNFKKKHHNFHAKNENSQKLLIGICNNDTFCFYSSCLSSVQIVKDIQRLDYWPLSWHGRVECCCNGLFLIGLWTQPMDLPPILLLWNPSTNESTILPDLEFPSGDYAYGLGYDSTSDDYKVLKIDLDEEDVVEILALKSGSWRKIDGISNRVSGFLVPNREGLAFVHGAFHWNAEFPETTVVTLNISNEMYGEIQFPEIPYLSGEGCTFREMGLSLLGGMLCVYLNDTISTNLWVMKEYGVKESWTKLFSIPSNGIHLIPIYRFSNGEVLLSYYKTKSHGTMIHKISEGSFGPSNGIWPLDSDGIDAFTIQDTFVYTESLISPKLGH